MKNLIQKLVFTLSLVSVLSSILSAQVVTVYAQNNFRGTSRTFNAAGDFVLSDWDVKSIRIQEGYIVQMAADEGCTGICTYWRSDMGNESLIQGARRCSIKIIRSNASNARLELSFITGNDDLRSGSFINFETRINAIGVRSTRSGPHRGSPSGGTGTIRLAINNTHLHQLLDMALNFRSGSSGVPFETTDNWNVNQIIITYSNTSLPDPIIIFRGIGNPLVRFTEENRRFNIAMRGKFCN